MNGDKLISAAEFFGEVDKVETGPSRPRRPRGKRPEHDLFSKIKENLVMRVYGVSREKAAKIIEERGKGPSRPEEGKGRTIAAKPRDIEEALDDLFAD